MIALDFDFTGLVKLVVIGAALVFAVWMHQVSGMLLWLLAAWYCRESHEQYVKYVKPYKRLGGHMKRAVNQ